MFKLLSTCKRERSELMVVPRTKTFRTCMHSDLILNTVELTSLSIHEQ